MRQAADLFPDAEFLTLREAAKLLPGRPHISTIIRWSKRGCSGRVLRVTKVGGRNYVTRQELLRFVRESSLNVAAHVRPPRSRASSVAASECFLAEKGV